MDQKQFDALLSDAETRLRRLKVLYEQWFMGIERVEPGQARKEFEDLLARMRKEQTNNTAQRFRLQQLVQRHITLSTHWRRIGRQIEEGTYQRDVLRAKKRKHHGGQQRDADEPDVELSYDVEVDDDLAAALAEADRLAETPAQPVQPVASQSKRGRTQAGIGPQMPLTAADSNRPPLQPDASPPPSTLTPFAVPGAESLRSKNVTPSTPPIAPGPLAKQPLAAAATTQRGAPPPPPPTAASNKATMAGEQLLGQVPGARQLGAPPIPSAATGRMPAAQTGAAGAAGGTTGRMPAAQAQAGSAGAAGGGAVAGTTGRMPAAQPGAAGAGASGAAGGTTGRMPAAQPGAAGAGAAGGGAVVAGTTGRMPAAQSGAAGAGAAGAAGGTTGRMPAAQVGSAGAGAAGGGAAPVPGVTGRHPVVQPGAANAGHGGAAGAGRGAASPPAAAQRGAAPLPPGAAASGGSAGSPPSAVADRAAAASPPSGAAASGAAARAAAAARQAKPQPAAHSGGAFSSQDVDRVYNQYVAARGKNAERTDNVKRESIEKTIRGMLPQLEQKHAGKKIDFEVVVKDGKVALKPVAK